MKKKRKLSLLLLSLLLLTSCGGEENNESENSDGDLDATVSTESSNEESPLEGNEIGEEVGEEELDTAPTATSSHIVLYGEVEITLGEDFLPLVDSLGEPQSISQEEESIEKNYVFSGLEVAVVLDKEKELVQALTFTDPNHSTAEGISIGMSSEDVLEKHGVGYEIQGSEYVYRYSKFQLVFQQQADRVVCIIYRLS